MSAFANFKAPTKQPTRGSTTTTTTSDEHEKKRVRKEEKTNQSKPPQEKDEPPPLPTDKPPSFGDLLCGTSFGGMTLDHEIPAAKDDDEQAEHTSDHHDYIRDNCLRSSANLKTFDDIIGVPDVVRFADEYEPVVSGARRSISGLLLFGPSGTGKSACAQAIAHHIGGTFYTFSAADMESGKKGAERVNALFDVVLSGDLPAVIFMDECDTILSSRATARVGHFATKFERFMENLLVIGATNEPHKIATKILTGRFERKILVDNPNGAARRSLMMRQLSQEEHEPNLSAHEMAMVVEETAGRSAVNLTRLVSTAVTKAHGMPVSYIDFEMAMESEPSDFDAEVARSNQKFDEKHGWRP